MDPKHKELLEQCQQKLSESVTDVDVVVELLAQSGSLSPAERAELDADCSGSAAKLRLLLRTLLEKKDGDQLQEFCWALEKTQPVLLGALLPVENHHNTGSTCSILSAMPSDSESSSSLSSVASSPPPAHLDKHVMSEKLETVNLQLRQVTRERDDLRKRLALSSPGTTFDDCRVFVTELEISDLSCVQSQSFKHCNPARQSISSYLSNQHTKTLKRCEEAVRDADYYHTLHGRAVGEQTQLRDEMEAMKQNYSQLLQQHSQLQQTCDELRRVHDNDLREVADMRLQQQQVMRENGSSELLNKLYDTALNKLEGMKKEYDALRKRYNEKTASHNADLSHLEQMEEENRRLQKQQDVLLKQRDSALHFQQQYSGSVRRFESLQQELNKASAQNEELQRETDRLQMENTRYKMLQLKAVKDAEKLKEERDSVFNEYRLIMSERDQVIKEVDKLQTGLDAAEARLKNTSSERRVAGEEIEALRQELNSALLDRDRAIREKTELLEKYCHEVQDKAETQKELSQACKDIEMVREERDVARKERTEAIIQRDQLLREYYQARQKQDSATLDMERVSKELEVLRKQCEAVSEELQEAVQEAEVAKCRRDWAFQERDKIVAERESIRTLCDNLRRERDRAVSDLADALRNMDDLRKQKNDAVRELKELKECMEEQLEKEARFRQLMAHNSHDSAIDTDSLEWETETVEFERSTDDMDLSALGFDIAEGVSDPYLPGDYGIFVSKVDKGSVAEGRLRVNDWLLKINDVDLANKDRKQVIKAVFSGGGVINMVVRRRKSLGGRMVTSVHLTLTGHKDCGVGLESGVFVSSVSPGSPAARDGSVCPGDRLLNINGISLDNKSVSECENLLRSCRDSVSLSLLKFFPQSLSGQSIAESQRDCERSSNGKSADQLRPCRKQATHKDMYSPTRDVESERGQRGTLYRSEPYHEICCPHPTSKRPLTFHPVSPGDCITVEMSQERRCIPHKQSGGTWPKMVAVAMTPTDSIPPLSIFKTPKKRKSIFDADMFKRPETPSKLDYLSLSQMPKHSPQSSWTEAAPQIPPDPPKRSDSFKFKHKPQGSSASDSTITTGSPPATPIQTTPTDKPSPDFESRDRNGNVLQRQGSGGAGGSFAEEVSGQGSDELEVRRGRPNSAPAQRRNLTPLKMPFPQSFSQDEQSPEPVDLVRFSPFRSNRHSFSPVQAHTTPRTLSPYPAVTAVMRNPVYTARSHCVKTTNSASVPAHTYTQVSPQHQGRWSVDLNHKRSGELFDGSRGSVQHNTNSLPSSARQGLSQYREQRIKIPSTPRYARSAHGSDRGSLSHSDCSSPSLVTPPLSPLDAASFSSSQSQGSVSAQTRLSVSPVPIDRRRDRPYIEEPRCVTIPKGAEPLGISIVGGENGGIFVSKVTGGSIAQKHHLEFGDQLLEFNGINLRNATEQQARLIIGQQCDTITILAQYNPHMHQLGNHSRSSSRMESSISSHSMPDTHSNIDTLSEQDEGTMTPPSKQATPTASPLSDRSKGRKQAELRLVVLRKTQVDLGLKICGGNLTGVFVEALEEDSPARGADGLQPGDLILECNSVSLKNKTAEEVYLEMLKPTENVTLRVQYRPEHFRRFKDALGDGFYIRALFDHVGDLEQELSFKKDDILYVDDTLPGGNLGYWLAWQLDENAQKLVRGHVPSKCMMDQDSQRRYSVTDGKDDSGSGKTLSAAARRSFFRRKLKHKRSSSKDGRDAPAADAVSTDSVPYMDDCLSPAYQRVLKVESTNRRPVLILGPLIEPIKDMLLREAPGKYCRCLPEGMKATQQAIERGVKDCLFIDYKRRSGHFDVTTVASIKEITEKDCHCLLDIAPYAIERLHVVNIYPIVIFIRYRNAKQIKEQKDPVYLRDKVSQKHSKEQFESAQRIEQDYSKYFTGVVQASSLSNICTQIMSIVDQEQNKVLWIPDGSM
ncbi:disks large homolog 5 [Sinocyclocheilus anshuiensis]|uniref:disks large homolog 5 n=1 Tax=Sinocyclocheilus anshuiensis TaxID=1608454 RepID=UPI0007B7DD45|nr:PREDICTED: disks large homolog 5-like [Sinocyclocheilus anshuiensis]